MPNVNEMVSEAKVVLKYLITWNNIHSAITDR